MVNPHPTKLHSLIYAFMRSLFVFLYAIWQKHFVTGVYLTYCRVLKDEPITRDEILPV